MVDEPGYPSQSGRREEVGVGFSRQFTGGFESVAEAREFVAATLLRDTELYEAARLLVDEAITNPLLHSEACQTARSFQVSVAFRPDLLHVEVHDGGAPQPIVRDGPRPASVAGRSLELFDTLTLAWDSSPEPSRPGHVVWFELEA
jgi:anti-sigma regulatory factor (Ser/Thr protein kinase)